MADKYPEIIRRPKNQRIWLVRAEGGTLLGNFRKGEVIALGHIDKLALKEDVTTPFIPDQEDLCSKIQRIYKDDELNERSFKSHYNQILRFIYEIKAGDIVVTPDEPYFSRLHLGRVTGLPRVNKKPIEVVKDIHTGRSTVMTYNLRRAVSWGPTISRCDLPDHLQRALSAQQSVSNLDEHWEAIYHILYPVFLNGDDFHFSIKIDTKDNIDNYTISQFFSFLSEMEMASQIIDKPDNFDEAQFLENFRKIAMNGSLGLLIKARFMSSGDIWGLLADGNNWVTFYMIYSAIFGSSKLGWDGLIDLHTRQNLSSFIAKRWSEKSGDHIY